MLDDKNVIRQRDPSRALDTLTEVPATLAWQAEVKQAGHDDRQLTHVVIAGMGGSALAAELLSPHAAAKWSVPLSIVRDYRLPQFVDSSTLVIAVSHSGNTEETISAYCQARERSAEVAVVASGGQLLEFAKKDGAAYVALKAGAQPRMATMMHLRALTALLANFGITDQALYDQLVKASDWLADVSRHWHYDVPVHDNPAKQLALAAVGKTPIIYAGPDLAGVAYKWKISWNENAKNTAWMGVYPEFNHNEFIGWSSHPVEKPFFVIDIRSSFDAERIEERMELSDRLLSGKRPKAHTVELVGDSLLRQQLWGCLLADTVSCYVAILNGVNPTPVELVEKLKKELS